MDQPSHINIDHLFASMIKINRYHPANGGLNLTYSPIRRGGQANKLARFKLNI